MRDDPNAAPANPACIDLEFDTANNAAPLGDIASSLVTLHDLLRDLAALAADPSSAEFRDIQVVAIEMRSPLKITLSLLAIPPEAVRAFQEICRDVILFREGRAQQPRSAAVHPEMAEPEARRLRGHITALQNAQVALKRVVVVRNG